MNLGVPSVEDSRLVTPVFSNGYAKFSLNDADWNLINAELMPGPDR